MFHSLRKLPPAGGEFVEPSTTADPTTALLAGELLAGLPERERLLVELRYRGGQTVTGCGSGSCSSGLATE
jgi:hypothetical protein